VVERGGDRDESGVVDRDAILLVALVRVVGRDRDPAGERECESRERPPCRKNGDQQERDGAGTRVDERSRYAADIS